MNRIVLGYDGSAASVAALSWVAARAGASATSVDVVNVVAAADTDRRRSLRLLGDAEERLRDTAPDVQVELHRLGGSAVNEIAEFAVGADLIVTGITTGHPIRAALAGAVPLRLTTHAGVPVCLVPDGWAPSDSAVTVGVADDDSSDAALQFAAGEAVRADVSMRLVHAWLMPTPSFEGATALFATPEQVLEHHRRVLAVAVEMVAERDPAIDVIGELVRDSPSSALLRFAPRSSLLVLGTHGRGLFAGSLLGSVAQETLWRAECAVCVVPSPASRATHPVADRAREAS